MQSFNSIGTLVLSELMGNYRKAQLVFVFYMKPIKTVNMGVFLTMLEKAAMCRKFKIP